MLVSRAFSRCYHTSSTLCNLQKQSKMMSKMLNVKHKRKWYESTQSSLPSIKSLSRTTKEPGKNGSRRVAVLNKLFMKNITDLMSTGSLSRDILGRGLEISKVGITADFQIVNVYWVSGGGASDEETEALLNRTAGVLRHELSQLRVMGVVPTIMFIKDEQAARLLELDRRLARADYGADYTPTEIGHLLRSNVTLNTKLAPEIKAKIQKLESEADAGGEAEGEEAPAMSHTVYGLEHAAMSNRMRAARRRSEDAWGRLAAPASAPAAADDVLSYRAAADVPAHGYDFEQQRQSLVDFLQKRQILQDALHKRLRSADDERSVVYRLQRPDLDDDTYEQDFDDEDAFHEPEDASPSA